MEKKNLVARITSLEDKRVNMVHLTKHGEKILNETEPILLEVIMQMQEGISVGDQKVVISVMNRIQENIEFHADSCNTNK
jgi:DNA-binding MarR family transcriptional regulator